MVNYSDDEIKEMEEEVEKSLYEEKETKKIEEFLLSHKNNPTISIHDAINKTFNIEGADISISDKGFKLYTKNCNIYGTFMDGCVVSMNNFLLKYFENGNGKNIYHKQYNWDGHFYIYPNAFKMKVNQIGKIFKRYAFEVVE